MALYFEERTALPQLALWMGYCQGYFLVPEWWVDGVNHCVLEKPFTFPALWCERDFYGAFRVDEYMDLPCTVVKLSQKFSSQRTFTDFEAVLPLPEGYRAVRLREFVGTVSDAVFHCLNRAAQILYWDQHSRFCATCGGTLVMSEALNFVKNCAHCRAAYYPQISPCVLVLVIRERPKVPTSILLAQGVRHAKGVFSVIAGYIDPGETAEQAVVREVYEETGIRVDCVQYQVSQSWPFPHALMLGFRAYAVTDQLNCDPHEIQDARWFYATNLANGVICPATALPIKGTLSRQLIDDYVMCHMR